MDALNQRSEGLAQRDGLVHANVHARVASERVGRRAAKRVSTESITHHKYPEKCPETEALYRRLVEQLPAITYILALDPAQTTLYISPQIESLLGFSPAEWMADPDLWNRQFHPDDRDRVLEEVARSHATGASFSSVYRLLSRDGGVVWFRDAAVVVRDASGQPWFSEGVMVDITAPMRSPEPEGDKPRTVETPLTDPVEALTSREREVVRLVAEGYSSPAIAARLFISPRTVETHRANLMRKLEFHTQTELVRYAVRRGIIPLND